MEQWEKNYYISSIAGATNGSSLVVMSKGIYTFPAFLKLLCAFVMNVILLVSEFVAYSMFGFEMDYEGTQYTQQSYKVSDSFPFKWINKKWREGFHVTSMATAGSRWGVVMSRNSGYSEQVRLH